MKKSALFIGRFQPFHLGHLDVVKRAIQDNDFLIIGIGSAENNYLPDNPFTASERWQMIAATLDAENISKEKYTIIPVRNINNYALWIDHVAKLVPPFQRVYTGSSIIQQLFKDHGKYEVIPVQFIHDISAIQTRKLMIKGKNWKKNVPKAVAELIQKWNGVERLKNISIKKKTQSKKMAHKILRNFLVI